MAAMMSRALDFSPLATVDGDACSEWEAGSLSGNLAWAGAGVVVTDGCGESSDGDSSAAAGLVGGESNSVG